MLLDAIRQKRLVRFIFDNKERIAEPHDYGIQRGQATLLAYQLRGGSTAGSLPNWRWIDVSRMSGLEVLHETFPGSRADQSSKHHEWEVIFARVDEADAIASKSPGREIKGTGAAGKKKIS